MVTHVRPAPEPGTKAEDGGGGASPVTSMKADVTPPSLALTTATSACFTLGLSDDTDFLQGSRENAEVRRSQESWAPSVGP